MKEIIYKLLIENGMTEKTVEEAIKIIEETAYKEGYEQGLNEGRQIGITASIRAINSIEKWEK
ncbi:hypothetical protein ACMGD3_23965 [Lysinibacillus sphaericus]|uniref:hypothetical protein n=1 Tax=Lysinibacillus sphaericus TaxID=1421 RepID=UPI003F78D833